MADEWSSAEERFLLQENKLWRFMGWSGGAKVLGKLSVPEHPSTLDNSRARAYCVCNSAYGGCLDIFSFVYLFSFLSPSLGDSLM